MTDDFYARAVSQALGGPEGVPVVHGVWCYAPESAYAAMRVTKDPCRLTHGALSLCEAFVRKFRSDFGRMSVSAVLLDAQTSGPTLQQVGAKLAVAHQRITDALEVDAAWSEGDVELPGADTLTKVGLQPGAVFDEAAIAWNALLNEQADSGIRFEAALIVAVTLYRNLLPEVNTTAIDIVAHQIWEVKE